VSALAGLSEEELARYDRQIRIFGREGQQRLKNAAVMVAGVGGLGSPAALYLAAAGVGKIVLVDKERVELSNLNRQILHWTGDIGTPKVRSAAEKLRKLNPHVEVEEVFAEINESNIMDLVKRVDLVIDGMDNWETRYLINRVCVEVGRPFIHAGVYGMHGQMLVIIPGKGPCLQCVIPEPPPSAEVFPVLGTTPGILAMMQVTEAVKILTGYGQPAVGKMVIYDGTTMTFEEISVQKREDCPVCRKK